MKAYIKENSTPEKGREQFQSFLTDCGIENPAGKRLLEIGFGRGYFLEECRKAGMSVCGYETDFECVEDTQQRFPQLGVYLYDGFIFPASSGHFDYVVSFDVLEHAVSIDDVIKECLRVLKPEGIMYHICPNYQSFYEGHYEIPWLPFLTFRTGKTYLKMLKKNTMFFEFLNIIKPRHIKKILGMYKNAVIISLGKKEFVKKFNQHQAGKIKSGFIRGCVKCLMSFRIHRFICGLICRANLYYPMTIIVQKTNRRI